MTAISHDDLPLQGRYQLQVDHDAVYAPEESAARRWRWIGSALLLALLSLGALCPLLRGEMLRTDHILLTSRPALDRLILDPKPPALDGYEYPGTRFTRFAATISPARYLLRAEQWKFDRDSARGFRFVGILLHAAAAILLFAIVQRLSLPWPWLTAAFYAVTPLAAGAVAPFVHQPILLSIVLALLATLVYLRWSGIDRREVESSLRIGLPESRWLLIPLTLLLWIAATLAHPFAAVAPAIWAVLAGWRLGRGPSWGQTIAFAIMVAAGIAYGIAIRIGFSGDTVGSSLTDLGRRVGLLPFVTWKTVRLGLWPSDASLVGVPTDSVHMRGMFLAAGATLAALVTFFWLTRKRICAEKVDLTCGIACFALLAYAAIASAPTDAGEVGPFEGTLLLPLTVFLIAATHAVASLGSRWRASHPPRDTSAEESDVELGLFTWRSVGLVAVALTIAIAFALPAAVRSFGFASQKLLVERDLDRHPDARRAVLAAVIDQAAEQRWFFAEQIVERQLARLPADIDLHLMMGQLYVLHSRYREAIVEFGAANKLDPKKPKPFEDLGSVLQRQNSLDGAEKAFRIAIELSGKANNPADKPQAALGALLLKIGRTADAQSAFEYATSADPYSVLGNIGLAQHALATGNAAAADLALTRLLSAYPTDAEVITQVGLVLAAAGDNVNAQRLLEYAVRIAPSASALNNLGTLLARQNRLPDAIRMFRRAVEIDPMFAVAESNLDVAKRISSKSQQGGRTLLTSP